VLPLDFIIRCRNNAVNIFGGGAFFPEDSEQIKNPPIGAIRDAVSAEFLFATADQK
jgi:hypothetical protein